MLALVHTIRQTTPRLPYALQTGYRPIVRGKEKAKVEFGAKIGASIANGYMLKTEDIHPPKTGISVHFSGSLV